MDRAVAAALSLAGDVGLVAEAAEIVQNSNKLAVRILPCDLLARVAVLGQHVGTLEIAVAERLAARGAPVARLDGRLARRVHERDGFAVTFWTYYEAVSSPELSPTAYAEALYRLHASGQTADLDHLHGFIDNDRLWAKVLEFHERGLDYADRSWMLQKILERFDLVDAASRPAKTYSGGMRRRLDLAAALVAEPEVLFLDEPTTGLDPQARHVLWDRLYRLKRQGVTQVLTTHYMDEAEQLCDRLVVMDKAKIVAEGSPRALIERYSTREVLELRFPVGVQETLDGRLEGLGDRVEQLPDLVLVYTSDGEAAATAAHERGLRPETVLVRRSSLEDVFLRLTGRTLVE